VTRLTNPRIAVFTIMTSAVALETLKMQMNSRMSAPNRVHAAIKVVL
jgi:hypothetical protein